MESETDGSKWMSPQRTCLLTPGSSVGEETTLPSRRGCCQAWPPDPPSPTSVTLRSVFLALDSEFPDLTCFRETLAVRALLG